MDFTLSEEHIMIRDAARDFAQTELLPGVIERDNKQEFPDSLVKKMGHLGFLGIMVDPKYGGSGMDTISYVLIMEELSKIDASAAVIVSVNNSLVCYGLEAYGNEEQKQKYLTKLASGEFVGAFCLSEPEAGSDATSQKTTAIEHGDHYIINGTKNWITNGGRADIYLVVAQTDRDKGSHGTAQALPRTRNKDSGQTPRTSSRHWPGRRTPCQRSKSLEKSARSHCRIRRLASHACPQLQLSERSRRCRQGNRPISS